MSEKRKQAMKKYEKKLKYERTRGQKKKKKMNSKARRFT